MTDAAPRPLEPPRSNDKLTRFIGGSPLAVLVRLILLSILVGVLLEVMGLDPLNLINSIRYLFDRIWAMGFDAVHWVWRYLILGAVVVVPVWLILRLVRAPQGK